jgi:hypothetical protein
MQCIRVNVFKLGMSEFTKTSCKIVTRFMKVRLRSFNKHFSLQTKQNFKMYYLHPCFVGFKLHPKFYNTNYITLVFRIGAGYFASSTSAMLATDYFCDVQLLHATWNGICTLNHDLVRRICMQNVLIVLLFLRDQS